MYNVYFDLVIGTEQHKLRKCQNILRSIFMGDGIIIPNVHSYFIPRIGLHNILLVLIINYQLFTPENNNKLG